ncbi:MAG: hypothetical protein U0667_09500 [Chloroflexota bacterium]
MTPSKAPILAELGYDVTWQIEGWPGTRSYQTKVAPDEGFLFDGITKGRW